MSNCGLKKSRKVFTHCMRVGRKKTEFSENTKSELLLSTPKCKEVTQKQSEATVKEKQHLK